MEPLTYPSFKEANGDFMMLDYHAASRLIKATNNTVDNFYHNSETDENGNHDIFPFFLVSYLHSQYFRQNKSCLLMHLCFQDIKFSFSQKATKNLRNRPHGFDVY